MFHRSTPWHSDIECSTKTYAKYFKAEGYRVSYLQDLVNPAHIATRRGYYDTWKRGSRMEDGVWVATACSLSPRLRGPAWLMDLTYRLVYRLSVPSLRRTIERGGQGMPDLIWTTAPGSSALKQQFPESKLAFHVVDYYPAFHGKNIELVEKRDYAEADLIFSIGGAVSAYLSEELNVPPAKVVTLGQGVALERYVGECPCPADLADIVGPRAVYVGVLSKLDLKLLESVASAMQQLRGSVVLIGTSADWLPGLLSRYSNVYYLGSRKSQDIPQYLNNCDIGLMLYDRNQQDVYKGQNPLKLYEYAAAGLPVISTSHEEFKYLDAPVWVVNDSKEVDEAVGNLKRDGHSAGRSMRDFAESHSWSRCVRAAEDALHAID